MSASPRIRERELTAGSIMSVPVAALPHTASIWDAWAVMIRDRIRHVVVVDGRRCLGVVTHTDLIAAWHQLPTKLAEVPVRTMLAARTACVLPDTAVREVARLMNHDRVDAVPVVDEHHCVIGLITAGDIVHAVAVDGVRHESADE